MKIKINLLPLLLTFLEGEGGGGGDVASTGVVEPSSTETSTADSTAGDVTAVEDAAVEEDDPLKDIPSLEELQQQAEQKVPLTAGLARLRAAYESVAPLKAWKETAESIGDPLAAREYYELVNNVRTPIEGQPNQFTTKPFIEGIAKLSPDAPNDLFFDLMTYEIANEKGVVDRMDRHYLRSLGIDPDRLEDYRNIDTIRASGAVTADDLSGIPERFHEAFRALSSAQRDDFLLQKDTNGNYSLASMEYLQDKSEALEARSWRAKEDQARQQQAEQRQQAFEAQLNEQIVEDVTKEAQSIRDSILKESLSQVTFSSDPTQDMLAKEGIMALLAQIQSPYPYQQQAALAALKAAGIEPNGFGELMNVFEEERRGYVRHTANRDVLQARTAQAKATTAKQQILARAQDYAMRLAKATSQRVATAQSQQNGQLAAATARYVPSGSQAPNGSSNPYDANPYKTDPTSPEYSAWIRKMDKEMGLTGSARF